MLTALPAHEKDADVLCAALSRATEYYGYAVRQLASRQSTGDIPGFATDQARSYLRDFVKDREISETSLIATIVIYHRLGLMLAYESHRLDQGEVPPDVVAGAEWSLFVTLSHLASVALAVRNSPYLTNLAIVGLREVHLLIGAQRRSLYRRAGGARSLTAARLATRTEADVKTYGKRLEGLFEQALTIAFRHLGFLVVSSSTGARRVDLICFSKDATEPMTFLVDGKTSSHPYALPVADKRALSEYIDRGQRAFPPLLPAPSFALIIGPPPSVRLARRVQDLQAEVQHPVRYMEAGCIDRITRHLSGPVSVRAFRTQILLSDCVVSERVIENIVSATLSPHTAAAALVQELLGQFSS
jgi:hypothetical protein